MRARVPCPNASLRPGNRIADETAYPTNDQPAITMTNSDIARVLRNYRVLGIVFYNGCAQLNGWH